VKGRPGTVAPENAAELRTVACARWHLHASWRQPLPRSTAVAHPGAVGSCWLSGGHLL